MPKPALLQLLQRWLPATPWPIASPYIAKWSDQDIIQLVQCQHFCTPGGRAPACFQQKTRRCWTLVAGSDEALTSLTDQSAPCLGSLPSSVACNKVSATQTDCLICTTGTRVIYEQAAQGDSSQHTSGSAQAAQSPPRCHRRRHRRHLRQSPRCCPSHAHCPKRGCDQLSSAPGSQASAGWCCRPCTRLSNSATAEQ